MTYMSKKVAIAAGVALAMSLPVQAVDNLIVNGYARSSSGDPVTSSSGECVRTNFKDSKELLEACGYKRVEKEVVEVDNQPAGAGVAVIKETEIVKDAVVLAEKKEIIAETFIQNLAFGFDNAELTTSDKAELDRVIAKLDAHRPLLRENVEHLNIIGYTDSVGADSYNQKLSERRAQAVADYFATVGNVRREVMKVMGRGESNPIGDNNTEEGRALNRRVIIEVVKH